MPEKTNRIPAKRPPAQQLRALLAAEGYRPRRAEADDDPSLIHFKVEGRAYLLRCEEDDPDFVQICTGYSLEDLPKDELELRRAANDVQAEMKVAKVCIPPSLAYVEFQLELFLGGRPLAAELLQRCIATLRHTSREFYERVSPRPPQALA
jgi:hypothetical protein